MFCHDCEVTLMSRELGVSSWCMPIAGKKAVSPWKSDFWGCKLCVRMLMPPPCCVLWNSSGQNQTLCLFAENTSEAGHSTPGGVEEHEKDGGELTERHERRQRTGFQQKRGQPRRRRPSDHVGVALARVRPTVSSLLSKEMFPCDHRGASCSPCSPPRRPRKLLSHKVPYASLSHSACQ